MVKRLLVTLPRLSGRKKRRAYIYLPASYRYDEERRYPVLYMFDGHNVFFDSDATYGKSWGMKDYLDHSHLDIIVAAVECNDSPDNSRLCEYSPFDFEDDHFGHVDGKGEMTMEWLIGFFKRYVDSHYRTLPGRETTFIAGSSMGGLMSIYALMAHNDVFSRAVALSPSLWTDPDMIAQIVSECDLDENTVLYMDYGSEEFGNHEGMAELFGEFVNLFLDKGVFLTSRIVPYGTHSEECWERQVPIFMNFLME